MTNVLEQNKTKKWLKTFVVFCEMSKRKEEEHQRNNTYFALALLIVLRPTGVNILVSWLVAFCRKKEKGRSRSWLWSVDRKKGGHFGDSNKPKTYHFGWLVLLKEVNEKKLVTNNTRENEKTEVLVRGEMKRMKKNVEQKLARKQAHRHTNLIEKRGRLLEMEKNRQTDKTL